MRKAPPNDMDMILSMMTPNHNGARHSRRDFGATSEIGMDQSHRARMLTLWLRPKPTGSVLEHRAIVQAIREGDASEAREHAKRHRARARDQLLPLLDQFGMRHL